MPRWVLVAVVFLRALPCEQAAWAQAARSPRGGPVSSGGTGVTGGAW